jgi:hypothetical protein
LILKKVVFYINPNQVYNKLQNKFNKLVSYRQWFLASNVAIHASMSFHMLFDIILFCILCSINHFFLIFCMVFEFVNHKFFNVTSICIHFLLFIYKEILGNPKKCIRALDELRLLEKKKILRSLPFFLFQIKASWIE